MSFTPKLMRQVVHALAGEMDRYEAGNLIDHGDERTYSLLEWNDHFNAWLICWNTDHETGFHDHDGSAVCYKVVRGNLLEETMINVEGGGIYLAGLEHHEGDLVELGPYDIHNVKHWTDGVPEPAVSIHVYSPPLIRMGSYGMIPGERLSRMPMTSDQPLRPLEAAALEHERHDEDGTDAPWHDYPSEDTRITG